MDVEDFKNKHEGERVFVVGNGPSLGETPLEKLGNEYTIATNRINRIYSSTNWRPSYFWYGCSTPPSEGIVDDVLETVELGIPCFISKDNKKYFPNKNNIVYVNRDNSVYAKDPEYKSADVAIGNVWSKDIGECVYSATSSIEVCAQIAGYMGFEKLIFVGCDGYKQNKPKKGVYIPNIFPAKVFVSGNDPRRYVDSNKIEFIFDNGTPLRSMINGVSFKLGNNNLWDKLSATFAIKGDEDNNHFVDNYNSQSYIKRNAKYKNKRLKIIHKMIKDVGKKQGFETYNATITKNIDIHEPIDFEDCI